MKTSLMFLFVVAMAAPAFADGTLSNGSKVWDSQVNRIQTVCEFDEESGQYRVGWSCGRFTETASRAASELTLVLPEIDGLKKESSYVLWMGGSGAPHWIQSAVIDAFEDHSVTLIERDSSRINPRSNVTWKVPTAQLVREEESPVGLKKGDTACLKADADGYTAGAELEVTAVFKNGLAGVRSTGTVRKLFSDAFRDSLLDLKTLGHCEEATALKPGNQAAQLDVTELKHGASGAVFHTNSPTLFE